MVPTTKSRAGNGRRVRRLRRARDGASAIEFALIAGFLSILLLGILDFGRGFWEQMQVNNAAEAGASYAQSYAYNQSQVAQAAQSATNLAVSVDVPPTGPTCGCATATGVQPYGGTCPGSCTSGSPTWYVEVQTSVSFSTLFPWPGLPRPLTLKGTAWAICQTQNSTCS